MSYNLYIDAIEEIKTRLLNQSAWTLFPVMFPATFQSGAYIRIGDRSVSEGNDQLPSIQILWEESVEDYDYIGAPQISGNVTVTLRIHYPVQDPNQDNIYYDKASRNGILYFISDMLDAINTSPAGTMDPRLGTTTKRAIHSRIGKIQKTGNDKLTCDIEITFNTKPVNANGRVQA